MSNSTALDIITQLGLLGRFGADVFISVMPNSPDVATLFTEYSASGVEHGMGGGPPTNAYPRVQVLVRGTPDEDYDVVQNRAMTLWNAMNSMGSFDVGGTHYESVMAQGVPEKMRTDENERIIFVFNHEVTRDV